MTRASPPVDRSAITKSADQLSRWIEARDYKAYDPGDGQLSYLRFLTFGSMFLERLLTAGVLRAPWNVRPILGIPPHTSTKGMGYMAWGYLYRYRETGATEDAARARMCLDWLMNHRSGGYPHYCWGNEFTFTTRAGRIPREEPTIVWSSLIGQAFVLAYETLEEQRYLDVASSVCDWILELPRESTASGTCLSYVAFDQLSIHNSNMLGGALLARVGSITSRTEALELARASMFYSCSRQREDGSWFYGEAAKYHWIDSFHTGYNLDSLKRYVASAGTGHFRQSWIEGMNTSRHTFSSPTEGCDT